ncbi:ABC-type multidrug transport system, ATPase and permease component [Pseudooceanicola nitratireducens]|uniref:ABC-type multidrug transport system, ATPase and permease component n=1 Tax=Pseudooceanicola nitratireducens TaxID=517719 RepID=A0A1I1N526_9RHOB|nr:ABC-type multidrug transport system, ATPase and permease component [Pseudooceanicola nitratireducens]SFC92774.1 ABC-type multidrug transport system, ATPase and permease component [Pseudooceanicola nitratireducens]
MSETAQDQSQIAGAKTPAAQPDQAIPQLDKTTASTDGGQHARGLLTWLWRGYLHRHIWWMLAALVFMALEGSMLGALSWMMKPMFDDVFIQGNTGALGWVGAAILSIFVLRALASVAQKVLLARISQTSSAEIRKDLLARLMRQDGVFHQTHPPGYLIQRVQSDVTSINDVWNAILTGAGRDAVALVILMGVAVSVDWRWTLIALVGAPILVLPSIIVQRFVRRRSREARDFGARLATRLDEVFHGMVPVKLNRLERYQSDRFAGLTDDLVRAEVRATLGTAAIPGLIDVMAGVGFLGVLIFGGGQIISGEKTVGEFMSFFTAIGFAFEPLRRLGTVSGVWQVAASGIERVRALMEVVPTIQSPAKPVPAPTGVPGVALKGVNLSYGDTQVLHGLNLVAKAGQTTALVGASGAGKSTVFNLLTRLVDPQEGQVQIGGVGVNRMSLPDLRGLMSVVSQDAALFDETLRENILLGRTDVSEERLQEVLKAAHVADFLPKLPQGLDSPVGPRGSNLSGGQRQRVAIARALLRDTPILLLDEATSALDAESEKVVQDALDRLSHGRTVLVIAHRLSTVREADKIVVMDRGRVVDEGTHEDLLAHGGLYARLHDLQFRTDGMTADKLALARAGRPQADSAAAGSGSEDPGATSLPGRIWRRLFGR